MPDPAAKTVELVNVKGSTAGAPRASKELLSVYREYVRQRMETSDVWGGDFKKQRESVIYEVNRVVPAVLQGALVGAATDRTGAEVDRPARRYDQTAFIVGGAEPLFLDFFKRQNEESGATTFTDVPFCSQRYLIAIGRSVSLQSSAKARESSAKDVETFAKTDCRSLLPELRAYVKFDATEKERSERLSEVAAFLTLLLIEHHAGGHFTQGLHTKLTWCTGKDTLPTLTSWQFAKGFDPKSITPLQVRRGKEGFVLEGVALLEEGTLVSAKLELSPTTFSLRLQPRGLIPYGP